MHQHQQHPREREENSPQTGRPRSIHEKEARNLLDVESDNTPDGKTLKKGLEIWERDLNVQQKRIGRKRRKAIRSRTKCTSSSASSLSFKGCSTQLLRRLKC
ncbi:unnamed protein product [Sphagnum jensenii]|uniref:Uncharacterized protein n=1 Tax=Sphagnum jensenii TaxID=128206 RepID=A0ABP1BGF8_9BRYO